MVGFVAAYSPLILLVIALLAPGYVYAKLTGRGEMAEGFGIEKIGADPDAPPEGWHDKPKKEEYPSTYLSAIMAFWRDPYFLLGFSVPVLYLIHLSQTMSATGKHEVLYVLAAVISNPFFGNSSEAPFVRAGTGFHIATTVIVVLALVISALLVIIFILVFFYAFSTSPECFGMTQNSNC